ncbi:MAG: uroporphyrinogen decarboxylase family protein [Eubacteriales bacterium]|nr:uroporphyrinogen decarboxylase family protein [Eubacteriales bacterium]
MNGYERMMSFAGGQNVDRPPFVPDMGRWAAQHCRVPYAHYLQSATLRAQVCLHCAEQFALDALIPAGDAYDQISDWGARPQYNADAVNARVLAATAADLIRLRRPRIDAKSRMGRQVSTVGLLAAEQKKERYIFGVCQGPFTDLCTALGRQPTAEELADTQRTYPVLEMFLEQALAFAHAQLSAGADGILIDDTACENIADADYRSLMLPLHRRLIDAVQRCGGFARLRLGPRRQADALASGARMVDVDADTDMDAAAARLSPGQML